MKKVFFPLITLSILVLNACQTDLDGSQFAGNLAGNIPQANLQIAELETENQQLLEQLKSQEVLLAEIKQTNLNVIRKVTPNAFEFTLLQPDEQVGKMTLKESGSIEDQILADGEVLAGYQYAIFEGEVELEGKYYYYDADDFYFPGQVCFGSLSDNSLEKLPLPMEYIDFQDLVYCFSNQDLAKNSFGFLGSEGLEGTAKIVVSGLYTSNSALEARPSLDLVRVINYSVN